MCSKLRVWVFACPRSEWNYSQLRFMVPDSPENRISGLKVQLCPERSPEAQPWKQNSTLSKPESPQLLPLSLPPSLVSSQPTTPDDQILPRALTQLSPSHGRLVAQLV